MKQARNLLEMTTVLTDQVRDLRRLEKRLSRLINELSINYRSADEPERDFTESPPSNIIPFSRRAAFVDVAAPYYRDVPRAAPMIRGECRVIDMWVPSGQLLAAPGESLPGSLVDYRPLLQRDGLILLSWDKRVTDLGERYTAYWVTSTGIPRFYASKPLSPEDFSAARPNHKSYAAEDGIEFYGQQAPVYIVHVAPELMMSNPQHGALRLAHIQTLKEQGSTVDFDYKYLLKTEKEKSRTLLFVKPEEKDRPKVG